MTVYQLDTLFPDLPADTKSWVYFGLSFDDLLLKIGATTRPVDYRSGELHFLVLCTVPGGKDVEAFYHKKYAAERVGRSRYGPDRRKLPEWFHLSDRILADMLEMCAEQRLTQSCAMLKAIMFQRLRTAAA